MLSPMPRLVMILFLFCVVLTEGLFLSLGQNTPATIGSANGAVIFFDRPGVTIPCVCNGVLLPPGRKEAEVHVSTLLNDQIGNPARYSYSYSVTGGRIIGDGAKAVWDFTGGFAPGEYSITVEVVEGNSSFKRSATRSIIVVEPCCLCPCECPSLAVLASKSQVKRSGKVEFVASLSGGPTQNVQYSWSVKNGVIEAGQGTPKIAVNVSSKKNAGEVVANLEIKLEEDCDCVTSVSESVPVGARTIIRKE